MRTKVKWLDPRLHELSCHLALFTTEKDLAREMRRLGVKPSDWPAFPRRAAVYYLEHKATGGQIAVVLVSPFAKGTDGIKIAAYLCHEAVHVWQFHLDLIGDKQNHSKEFEAYAIDAIAEELMREFYRQTKGDHYAKD